MFPNVLTPAPLHSYSPPTTLLATSSAFLVDNLLSDTRPQSPALSPGYESSDSPCPTDFTVRKTDRLSPGAGDSSADQDHSSDSRLEIDSDSRHEGNLEPEGGWTPQRGITYRVLTLTILSSWNLLQYMISE